MIELETTTGKVIEFALPEPGAGEGFFVLCLEYSGNNEFWALLERLAAAARQPLWKFHESLRTQGLFLGDLTIAARQKLFRLTGYGLGILFDAHPMLRDPEASTKRSVMFIRDPRDMICTMYLNGAWRQPAAASGPRSSSGDEKPPPFAEFVASPRIVQVLQRYRRLVAFRKDNPHLATIRYEQALAGWSGIAADLVAFLNLRIEPAMVATIAADAPRVGNRLPWQPDPSALVHRPNDSSLTPEIIDRLEIDTADILAALGFAHRQTNASRASSKAATPEPDQAPKPKKQNGYAPPPLKIFEPDPVIFGRLRPNSSSPMQVLGRQVMMEVDASGCRPVINQPETADQTIAFYGCSFTYGIAVASEETFASRVQQALPAWRVENHGISGHGTAQNLLLLQRHARWNKPEYVAFCWIGHHLIRNVVDITWVQSMSRRLPAPRPGSTFHRAYPRAALDASGALVWRSTAVPRVELGEADWSDFSAEPFYQDQVCFRLFEEADRIVRGNGGQFFVITLWGQLSDVLAGWLAHAGIPVLDASLGGNEYTCMPDDPHPNARAHEIYAGRIAAYLACSRTQAPVETAVPAGAPAWPIATWPIATPT